MSAQAISSAAGERGRFLRVAEVIRETGLSRSTIYRQELAGEFPKRVQLSANSMGWWSADLDQWLESRRAPALS